MRRASAVAALALLVLLAVVARLHSGAVHRLDVRLDDDVNRYLHRRPGQVHLWRLITDAGGPVTWRVAAGLAAVALWMRRKRATALLLVVAMAGAAALSELVKVTVRRPRPTVPFPVEHVAGGSFPSGHALTSATALSLAVVLAAPHLRRAARVLVVVAAALIAVAVGASRVMLGVHYLTDVLGGWLLAGLWVGLLGSVPGLRPTSGPRRPPPAP